jgi:predicted GIY-YIG superfamily endonuclease
MRFFVYALHLYFKSLSDQGYYFGHTIHLEQRLSQHNAKKVRSTKSRTPSVIHYYETFSSKAAAYHREMFFKTKVGRLFLIDQKIIQAGRAV